MRRNAGSMVVWITMCAFALQGCSLTYSADPITAKVVDAYTKQPLEGVIVVALWQLEGGLEGGNIEGNAMVMESVTDATGEFHFPAWGPKRIPIEFLSNTQLRNEDPFMLFFKSGYRYAGVTNEATIKKLQDTAEHRSSEWNGKTIPMKKFDGTLDAYALHIYHSYPAYLFNRNCDWRNIPALVIAVREQTASFQKAGIRTGNFYTELELNNGYGCGSFDQFVQEHQK